MCWCLGKATSAYKVTLEMSSGLVYNAKAIGVEEKAIKLREMIKKVKNDAYKYFKPKPRRIPLQVPTGIITFTFKPG